MAPAAAVGVGLGINVAQSIDEEIADHVDALKELWVKKHGRPLHVAEVNDQHRYILITTKLDS